MIIFPILGITTFFLIVFESRRSLHLLQLEDYSPTRMLILFFNPFWKWSIYFDLLILLHFYFAMLSFILSYNSLPPFYYSYLWVFSLTVVNILILIFAIRTTLLFLRGKKAKKPLVKTARLKRIRLTMIVLSGVLAVLITFLCYYSLSCIPRNPMKGWVIQPFTKIYMTGSFILIMLLFYRIIPFLTAVAVYVLHPLETYIQNGYLKDARRVLLKFNPLVVGITGSYGKTGTKELLAAMLSEKFSVFKPPGSYNTLMGVTKIIREKLRPYHEIFVAEMGAYKIGSIKKLCNLTNPKHGIITTIGLQHLERFKTQSAIQQAKAELVKSLPNDGIAVLNGNDPLCKEIGNDFPGEIIYFKVESESEPPKDTIRIRKDEKTGEWVESTHDADFTEYNEHAEVIASQVKLKNTGSNFSLNFNGFKGNNEEISIHIPLLGRLVIANAAAAAAMAFSLGVPSRMIKLALESMPQVPHRLEAKRGEGGVTIIDDAFNSNPIGASSALEVLSKCTDGRRILVTPGMIELGKMEEESNYNFGSQAALACDLAVLVGAKRIEPIFNGLIAGGFDENHVWVVESLNEGLDRLKEYLKPDDTVLLENDLPDQYDKK